MRVWNVADKDFTLRFTIENGPTEDLNFTEWHPKGNAILAGGKDFNIWMFNGNNGDYVNCFSGHEEEVLQASFTVNDDGKHIVSAGADKTIRLWSRSQSQALQVKEKSKWGYANIYWALKFMSYG